MALYCILYSAASCVLQVAGMLVLNAHNVADTSGEGFAVRLFRKGNQRGFIRALSDQPAFFAAGFNKVRQCPNEPHLQLSAFTSVHCPQLLRVDSLCSLCRVQSCAAGFNQVRQCCNKPHMQLSTFYLNAVVEPLTLNLPSLCCSPHCAQS